MDALEVATEAVGKLDRELGFAYTADTVNGFQYGFPCSSCQVLVFPSWILRLLGKKLAGQAAEQIEPTCEAAGGTEGQIGAWREWARFRSESGGAILRWQERNVVERL
jgi:hypothetical protein